MEQRLLGFDSPVYVRFLWVYVAVITRALERLDPINQKLVDLVFWQGLSIEEASKKICLDETQTNKRINDILCYVAHEFGLLDETV